MLARTRAPALLVLTPHALVLANAPPPPALLVFDPFALVLADARVPELLACAPFAVVMADARVPELLASAPLSLVLVHAVAPALLGLVSLALVRVINKECVCVAEKTLEGQTPRSLKEIPNGLPVHDVQWCESCCAIRIYSGERVTGVSVCLLA